MEVLRTNNDVLRQIVKDYLLKIASNDLRVVLEQISNSLQSTSISSVFQQIFDFYEIASLQV